jgi:hypothetical protein
VIPTKFTTLQASEEIVGGEDLSAGEKTIHQIIRIVPVEIAVLSMSIDKGLLHGH